MVSLHNFGKEFCWERKERNRAVTGRGNECKRVVGFSF